VYDFHLEVVFALTALIFKGVTVVELPTVCDRLTAPGAGDQGLIFRLALEFSDFLLDAFLAASIAEQAIRIMAQVPISRAAIIAAFVFRAAQEPMGAGQVDFANLAVVKILQVVHAATASLSSAKTSHRQAITRLKIAP
jgi:hypothetical protein